MTKDELLTILRENTGDHEADHGRADDALLEYIDDSDIRAAFNADGRYWYA